MPVSEDSIDNTLRVLYVHHVGVFGGASRSLLELIHSFPRNAVKPHLIAPPGAVARLARGAGIAVIESAGIAQFDQTRIWLLLTREIAYLLPTLIALVRAKRCWPVIDLVHINDATLVPVIILAPLLFRCPMVLHVRAVQHPGFWLLRSRLLHRILRRVNAVVAIDKTVRRSLPQDIPCEVIHNGLNATVSERTPRAPSSPLRIGMVGNLLPMKGVSEFIDAIRLCKARGLNVKFVIYGGNTRKLSGLVGWLLKAMGFARDMEREVREAVERDRLESMVELPGFNHDLDLIYRSIDVLCFPSQLDAPGRPVFEAAFWGVPSIVAIKHPQPDSLVPGETGIAIDAGSSTAIADAIEFFCRTPSNIERMGDNARRLAEKYYNSRNNAAQIWQLYRRILKLSTGT